MNSRATSRAQEAIKASFIDLHRWTIEELVSMGFQRGEAIYALQNVRVKNVYEATEYLLARSNDRSSSATRSTNARQQRRGSRSRAAQPQAHDRTDQDNAMHPGQILGRIEVIREAMTDVYSAALDRVLSMPTSTVSNPIRRKKVLDLSRQITTTVYHPTIALERRLQDLQNAGNLASTWQVQQIHSHFKYIFSTVETWLEMLEQALGEENDEPASGNAGTGSNENIERQDRSQKGSRGRKQKNNKPRDLYETHNIPWKPVESNHNTVRLPLEALVNRLDLNPARSVDDDTDLDSTTAWQEEVGDLLTPTKTPQSSRVTRGNDNRKDRKVVAKERLHRDGPSFLVTNESKAQGLSALTDFAYQPTDENAAEAWERDAPLRIHKNEPIDERPPAVEQRPAKRRSWFSYVSTIL